MGPAQRTVGAPGKWATSLGGRGGFLKKVMPELNLEKNDRIHQVYERNRWAFQVGGRACERLGSIMFHRKPLNSPGLEAGEVWGEEGERLAKALEVVRRSLGFL